MQLCVFILQQAQRKFPDDDDEDDDDKMTSVVCSLSLAYDTSEGGTSRV